jgi:hypothetical protein
LHAATELASIINNDAAALIGNIADNNNNDEQLIDAANDENIGNHANNNDPPDVVDEQLNVAAPVENVGNHANNNDPPDVVDEQSNDAADPICNIADSIDNNEQQINAEAAPVRNIANSMEINEQLNDAAPVENVSNHVINNDCHEVADGQLIEAVVGNGNIETTYVAIYNDGTTLTAPTIKYLNDQLELRDKKMCDLEAKIVDLESKMTALSESVGDWRCTFVNSNSRFSHMTGFTLGEGLNFVWQGRGRGNEEVGDEEEDSGNGDQKQNACKRKRASEGEEVKRDNEEDNNGNGDQKQKANRRTYAHVTYCKEYPPSQRGNRPATGANAGLINANVICYSNAIFQCIASCANLNNYADFLRSSPNEEHRHFKLYYEFKSVISSILRGGMDGIDPRKFTDLYKKC